ncbi:MAG: DUF3343 domain-containing protein [Clostridia bacterium]|nr:DUF3343 domain-containing protein [Clostridiales bacterium]MBQ3505277.1 DUF3343 domain-containing protein [Clostridia bacterium]
MMILAVFRSRAHSLAYAERLNGYGVPATTVPAPKEAKIGCGLCVRFDARFYVRAKAILKTGKYPTFKGFYKTEFLNGRMTVTPYN